MGGEAGPEVQEGGGAQCEAQPVPGAGEKTGQAELSSPPEKTAGLLQSSQSEEEPGGLLSPGPALLLHQQSTAEEAG